MNSSGTPTDSADIVVRAIDVQLLHTEDQLLTVRYELATVDPGDQRPLLVDFSLCPLWPVTLDGSDVSTIEFSEDNGTPIERIFVRRHGTETWEETFEVTITLKWIKLSGHVPLLGEPYLYLPADLPRIGKRAAIGVGQYPQPSLRVRGELQTWLVGAQAYVLGQVVSAEGPLLRGVLGKMSSIRINRDLDSTQLCLIGDVTRDMSAASVDQLGTTISQMCNYFRDRLQAPSGLRLVAALDSGSDTRRVAGPLIAQSIDRYHLPKLDQAGHEFPIAREIAANWWGTGVWIDGPEGVYLSGGIAFGLGLSWPHNHARRDYINALLQYYTERIVESARFKHVAVRPGERSAGIGVILYQALATNPKLWKVLQRLTGEFWNCYVPEDMVLASLAEGGFPVGDFAAKRFLRTETM